MGTQKVTQEGFCTKASIYGIMMLMRTTLTLDQDVTKKVRDRIRQSGKNAKEVYNELLRSALAEPPPKKAAKKFKLPVFAGKMGLMPGYSWDMPTAQMFDKLDEDSFSKK